MDIRICCLLLLSLFATSLPAQQNLYFPPVSSTTSWETAPPATLGFCPERIDSLFQFLDQNNTKGFILLQNGKIVLEKYFDTFTQDSLWYWASAGKSLSAYLAGIAMEENGLQLDHPVSNYLGAGWTVAPPDKENLIQVKHLLSMSSGLDDNAVIPGVSDPDNCTDPACLIYKADAGTRWAYHNGPYHLVHDVLEEASSKTLNQFTKTRLFDRIGSKGFWVNHVMYSTPRSMARFGLLCLAKGAWANDTILRNQAYIQSMSQSTQNLNQSYGYLWWLNGQNSFMLPGLQLVLPGELVPNAPADMYAALGKNDQKIHVVPSKGWVVVRMGEASGFVGPNGGQVPIAFDNLMWDYLNKLTCIVPILAPSANVGPLVLSNPADRHWSLAYTDSRSRAWELYNAHGQMLSRGSSEAAELNIDATAFDSGVYFLQVIDASLRQSFKLVKQ